MTTSSIQFHDRTADNIRKEISNLVQQYADIVHAPKPFVPGETPVPVSGKVIGAAELKNMVDASLDGWLTTGRFNAMFEQRLADFLGVQYLITVNSGSSANLVAFSTHLGDITGQVFALFVLTVAAAEAAIGLAILVVFFRNRGTIAVEDINMMKG